MNAEVVSQHRYIKLKDAAMEIGMSTDYVRENLIANGKIVAVKQGSRWLVDIESWRRYLDSLKRGAA